jgi:hypothetical protein
VSQWLPRRVQAGVAVGLAAGFVVLANSAAVADQVRDSEWWLQALHVTQAWQSSHGSGVTVAVLDTGVNASQPDLTGSVTSGPDFTNSGRVAGKPFWGIHGTEVASLIAGHGHGRDHSEGIIGVAPEAKILSVRVTLEPNDPLLSDPATAAGLPDAIARGITYAVRHGATVIDLPLDPVTAQGAAGSGGSAAERKAVQRALAHHVVLVAPAGDDGAGTDAAGYPAAYRGVISVGAFNSHFVKSPFTSHQPYVTLTAAGQGVAAADPAHGYKQMNSTSAASAMVAGAAALIKSQFPRMTPAEVTRALTHSTAFRPKSGHGNGSGYGTLDAGAALMMAAKIAEAVPKTTNSAGGTPPTAPPVHTTAVSRNLTRTLAIDAGIAAVVFLVLLGVILAIRAGQRRHARAVRLAEVRAAARVQRPAEPVPPAGSTAGYMTSPSVPAIPGMPAAGSVPGAGSLPGAVASRLSGAAAEPAPGGADRPGPAASRPAARLPLRQPPAKPAEPEDAPQSAAPYGMTSAGLPRRVQPASGFPKSAFPRGTSEGSLFASGTSAEGSSLFSRGPAAPGGQAASTPVRGAAPGGAFPGTAFRSSTGSGNAFADPPPAADRPAPLSPAPASMGETGTGGGQPALPHRADTVHRPPVSGRPPWEPAARPDSDLPWNQAPAPSTAATPLPQRGTPYGEGGSSWDAIAEEVWPGGPRSAGPHPHAPPTAEPESGPARSRRGTGQWGGTPAGEEQSQRDRPIYVWNPGPGGSGPPDTAAHTHSTPPWETAAAGGETGEATHHSTPPWDALADAPPQSAGPDSLAGFGASEGDTYPAAPAAGTGRLRRAAPPAEQPGAARPAEEGGFGSAYLPAAPRLPEVPGVAPGLPGAPGGTNGGTANSYLWSAKSDPMGNSFPGDIPAEGARSFDPTPAGESTETFTAVTPEAGKAVWRLSLPTESTETFPAIPRGEDDGRQEDS